MTPELSATASAHIWTVALNLLESDALCATWAAVKSSWADEAGTEKAKTFCYPPPSSPFFNSYCHQHTCPDFQTSFQWPQFACNTATCHFDQALPVQVGNNFTPIYPKQTNAPLTFSNYPSDKHCLFTDHYQKIVSSCDSNTVEYKKK